MHRNMVQRTKCYFILLAFITTISLFFLTLKWGTISQIYKITSHETHVHIQQIPAMDRPLKTVPRYIEKQIPTSKPNTELVQKTAGPTEKSSSTREALLSKTKKGNGPLSTESTKITGNSKVKTEIINNTKTSNEKKLSKQESIMEEKYSGQAQKPGEKSNLSVNKTLLYTVRLKERQVNDKETSADIKNSSFSSVLTNNQQINENQPKRESGAINEPHLQINNKKTNKMLKANNQATVDAVRPREITELQSADRRYVDDKKATVNKTHKSKDNQVNFSANNNQNNKTEEFLTKPQVSRAVIIRNSQNSLSTNVHQLNAYPDKTNDNNSKDSANNVKVSHTAENKQVQNSFTSKSNEKLKKTSNKQIQTDSKVITEHKNITSLSHVGEKQSVLKPDRDSHPVETAIKVKTSLIQTTDHEEPSKLNEMPRAAAEGKKDDTYESKKKMIQNRLKSIKEQLINRTIISDSTRKYTQDESISNKKDTDKLPKQNGRSVNRYLQQRLRHLGLQNRLRGFNEDSDLERNDLQGSDRTVRPDACKSCFDLNFRITINEENLCTAGDTSILILISTAPQNREARDAIRKTWGEVCRKDKSNIKCLFVLGNAMDQIINEELKKESLENHDMVQIDFKDSYANLTYKTMTGLKWANQYCTNARFVMKTDDDMYVNTELLPLLIGQLPTDNFLGGFCWGPSSPHRDRNSKWFVSYRMYRGGYYPSMCSGTGYILSSDIMPKILKTSRNIPFFYLEDVYLALCVNKLGLYPSSISGFHNLLAPYSRCDYRNNVITSHQISPETLKFYWDDSRLCEETRPTDKVFYLNKV